MSGNNKDSDSTTKCFSNIELVKNICKYLNYKQQLQLLQANKTLEQIIANFVWKTKFAEVDICIINDTTKVLLSDNLDYNDFHTGRQTHEYRISRKYHHEKHIFQAKELDTILKLNAGNVKKLQIRKKIYTGCEIMPFLKPEFPNLTFLRCDRIAVTNNLLQKFSKKLETLILIECLFEEENGSFKYDFLKQEFPNLTFLRCEYIDLPHKILQQLSEKLETLILIECLIVNEDGSFGTEIDIKIWKNMPNLKNLEISRVNFNMLEHAKCILHELKLQRLVLDFEILDIDVYFGNTSENLKTYKYNQASNIHADQCSKGFLNFETNLPKFENLCDLTLKMTSLTGEFFGILSTCCKNLTKLSLRDCKIDNFITLPKLQELTLINCCDDTALDVMHINILNTILGEMNLKWFTSLYIQYNGYLELFPISPTLEKLNCDFSESNLVELLRFNSANLQNLSDLHWRPCQGTNLSMRLSDVAPNLRVLRIPERHLNSQDFYQMKFLQKLIISGTVSNIDVVLTLLKHENLRELIILSHCLEQAAVDIIEFEAFKTKLLHIQICDNIFSELKDFWFDLLKLNSKLSLTVFRSWNAHAIREMITSNNFPSRFKSVNICGVSIDYISIQNGSPEIMAFIREVERFEYGGLYFKLE